MNFGEYLQKPAEALNVFPDNSADVRLVRFISDGPEYCSNDVSGNLPALPAQDKVRSLLSEGDRDLALHSFTMQESIVEGEQSLYRLSFILGTPYGGVIEDGTPKCQPNGSSDDDYCAVNEFVFSARAGNREQL